MRSHLGAETEIFTKDVESNAGAFADVLVLFGTFEGAGWSGSTGFFCDSVALNAQFALSQ